MEKIATTIPDVFLIAPKIFGDARGFFMETYHQGNMRALGIEHGFVQDNHSRSARGVLRGLHYQIKHAQGKLVRVVNGAVFDVAVDMRRSSPSFGRSVGFVLSSENQHMAWIPPGFAHGFYVLSETVDFLYKATDYYAPDYERTLQWNDPALAIEWPLAGEPQLSAKDRIGKPLAEAETFA